MTVQSVFLQYTVDAVSLDDDDLATVAEDDGSLASQEEKSVIFSPQPTTTSNLATDTLGKLPAKFLIVHHIGKEAHLLANHYSSYKKS